MMKKVFISGPVSDLDYAQVKKSFNDAELMLLNMGFQVMNPITFVPEGESWNKAMRRCIAALSRCDIIYMLQGFSGSRGAMFEFQIANGLDMEKMFQSEDESI